MISLEIFTVILHDINTIGVGTGVELGLLKLPAQWQRLAPVPSSIPKGRGDLPDGWKARPCLPHGWKATIFQMGGRRTSIFRTDGRRVLTRVTGRM